VARRSWRPGRQRRDQPAHRAGEARQSWPVACDRRLHQRNEDRCWAGAPVYFVWRGKM